METKEVVIDEETMEQLIGLSARKGRNLEELVHNYGVIYEMGKKAKMGKKPDKSKMSPALAAFAGVLGKVPEDYDWKKDIEDVLYEKYLERR